MLDATNFPLWANIALFVAAAAGVWRSGARLTVYADTIADRTGFGEALIGTILLGTATSLPEIATTGTASLSGNAPLAGNNLLGGVAMQIAVIALVDFFFLRGRALTFFSPSPVLLTQGLFLIVLVAMAAAAVAVGDVSVAGWLGIWPIVLGLVYLLAIAVLYHWEGTPRWQPRGELAEPPQSAIDMKDAHDAELSDTSTRSICFWFALCCVGVLVSGVVVAKTGEAIAEQTGLGAGFVGATLVAFATSLPEISTTTTAVRIGAYSMAISNIVGTNMLEVALFLPADVLYTDGLIFEEIGMQTQLLAMLGIVTTAIFMWGILERRDRTVCGMGVDSAAVLALYVGGMALFYAIG